MTKLTNEELVAAVLGPDVEFQGDFARTHRAEILQRMAEGAAGEASLLVISRIEWQAILDAMMFTESNVGLVSDAHIRVRRTVERKITDIDMGWNKSASASTAGPRPDVEEIIDRLNLVGQLLVAMDDLEPSDPMADAIETAQCDLGSAIELLKQVTEAGPRPRCPNALTEENLAALEELEVSGWLNEWTGMELVHVHQGLERLLKEVRFHRAQFFAAAPAEDTKATHDAGTLVAILWRLAQSVGFQANDNGSWKWEDAEKAIAEKLKPEDVQLDVEARELESAWEMLVERDVEVYTLSRVMVDRDAYGRAERAVTSLLALLRRVSGKGAQGCSCDPGNHANATECHNFGANGCTGATTQGTPEGAK